MTVLAADDDPQILKALRIILAAHGYEVVTASDGKEAIQAAAHDLPDLILLDLGMPGLGGVAVIEAVRGWSTMPILVVSGRSDTSGKVDALDAGANDYVVKPFATEELLARIRALTRRAPEAAEQPTVVFGDVVVDLPRASDQAGRRGGATDADGMGGARPAHPEPAPPGDTADAAHERLGPEPHPRFRLSPHLPRRSPEEARTPARSARGISSPSRASATDSRPTTPERAHCRRGTRATAHARRRTSPSWSSGRRGRRRRRPGRAPSPPSCRSRAAAG